MEEKTEKTIDVFLADDHVMVREGLAAQRIPPLRAGSRNERATRECVEVFADDGAIVEDRPIVGDERRHPRQ